MSANWTRKARTPRKTKKAQRKVYAAGSLAILTPTERRRYGRCHFTHGSQVRNVGAHVAMGDTSNINARLRRERMEARRG